MPAGSLAGGGCISANGNVTLLEVAMQDCTAQSSAPTYSMHGGAIHSAGNVRLEAGVFMRNNKVISTTSDARGGAIHAIGVVSVTGNGVEIITNTASPGPGQAAQGGGIYAGNGIAGTHTALISSNVAGGDLSDGGGIYSNAGALASRWELRSNHANRHGGGIYLAGAAILGNMLIVENSADFGAGVYADAALTLNSSMVADNQASSFGGGVEAKHDLTLNNSTIIGNSAETNGGGIRVLRNASINKSTISSNSAKGTAGARLGWLQTTSLITVDQSTITNNQSSDSTNGAGLWLYGNARIRNSTIYNNRAENGDGSRHGSGISLGSTGAQLELVSSIVSRNRINKIGTICLPPTNCFDNIAQSSGSAATIAGQANLIGTSLISLPTDTIQSDSPGLGTLEDNGGPTPTHLPNSTSAAIDAGVDNGFTTDQRGDGFPRVIGVQADIGAVEAGGSLPPEEDDIFADGFED